MESDPPDLEMRPFVMSLLVAATGERTLPPSLDLVHNSALRYSLELAGHAPTHSRDALAGDPHFGGWADAAGRDDFFLFCGALLDAVDARQRGRHPSLPRKQDDRPTSYDHAALLALGQALCRAAGVRRATPPPFTACLRALSASRPRDLQERLLANYLGNILQDYFDTAEIRAAQVSYPPDFERGLRDEEATDLARVVFAALPGEGGPVDLSLLQEELGDVIGHVWIALKDLDA